MSASNDIIWTSFIPGFSQIEQMDFEWSSPEPVEGTAAEGAAPAAAHPAYHVTGGFVIVLVILALAFITRASLKKGELTDDDLIPSDKITVRNVMEIAVSGIVKLMEDVMGDAWPRFFHLIGALALYILISNLSGLVPGFLPATENINTTAALGLIVFFATHYYGFREHGVAYLKHFAGPLWWLAPLMFPIELISHLARPMSLALRLFGNIVGDHKVGTIFFGLVAIGVPMAALFLGVFVSCMQTFVFCLMSMIYLSGAVSHDH
jgi:F-type H+-transporting ATPase subunit a